MNLQRRIRNLNSLLARELGWVGSNPRYAWHRASELFYQHEEGYRPASKIIVGPVVPNYVRHSWAEKFGADVWVLAKWDLPRISAAWDAPVITEDQWVQHFGLGAEAPYPEKGQYYAIENTKLLLGQEPDENDTKFLIRCIKDQEAPPADLISQLKASAKKPNDDAIAECRERIDSDWNAFDNEHASEDRLGASRGGHVSFGGV